jgi:hypothetical protein
MAFIKTQKQLLLAGPLAVAAAAFTVTACAGGGGAALAQGGPPGQWTKAETSQFTASGGRPARPEPAARSAQCGPRRHGRRGTSRSRPGHPRP